MTLQITPLPTPPSRQDPTNFSTRADAFLSALPTFATETNALAVEAGNNAVTATTQAGIATTQAGIATTQAGIATTQASDAAGSVVLAQQAAISAGAIAWVSGTTYAIGALRYSPIDYQTYRRKTAGAGTTDPILDQTNWQVIGKPLLKLSTRSANTVLSMADFGQFIDITSGTFTQTFGTAASLTDGWWCYYRNSGTGDITLAPSGSETIDGVTSFVCMPGEMRLIQRNGTSFRSVVITPFSKTYTASGPFPKPPGYKFFEGLAWSGGSGGRKASDGVTSISGGFGGGCFPFKLASSLFALLESIVIGAGGIGPSTSNTSGSAGGQTSIGALVVVAGADSSYAGAVAVGGAKLTVSGPDTDGFSTSHPGNSAMRTLYGGIRPSNDLIQRGQTMYGGAHGGSFSSGALKDPGSTVFGGAGGAASLASSGSDGVAPGGGGGATQTGAKAGDGARGEVRIWGVI